MSSSKSIIITVSPTVGKVSGLLLQNAKSQCGLVLAHGAGAGMHHIFMEKLAGALLEWGVATLRFNFPFIENKKGRPDVPGVAHTTIQAATAMAQEELNMPLFAGGKSFGGRMTSQWAAKENPQTIRGLVYFGFPLHPPGNPSVERAAHLNDVKLPMLFLQGTRDALADLDLMKTVTQPLKKTKVVYYEGADHSFKAPKQDLIPTLAQNFSDWAIKH